MTTNYAIDDGNGNQLTAGLQGSKAREAAQRLADERGESVWLYQIPVRLDDDGEPVDESEEIEPRLERDADTAHESAEDMYDGLGNHWDWYGDRRRGQVQHPVCTVDQLDTMTDAQILAAECPEPSCDEERWAYEDAIKYARQALADMRDVETALEEAVEAYERGDADGVIEGIRCARSAEAEYGDWPAARALGNALLVRGAEAVRS